MSEQYAPEIPAPDYVLHGPFNTAHFFSADTMQKRDDQWRLKLERAVAEERERAARKVDVFARVLGETTSGGLVDATRTLAANIRGM